MESKKSSLTETLQSSDDIRIPEGKKRRGRSWKNCLETIVDNWMCLGMSRDEAGRLLMDRDELRSCISRCANLHDNSEVRVEAALVRNARK